MSQKKRTIFFVRHKIDSSEGMLLFPLNPLDLGTVRLNIVLTFIIKSINKKRFHHNYACRFFLSSKVYVLTHEINTASSFFASLAFSLKILFIKYNFLLSFPGTKLINFQLHLLRMQQNKNNKQHHITLFVCLHFSVNNKEHIVYALLRPVWNDISAREETILLWYCRISIVVYFFYQIKEMKIWIFSYAIQRKWGGKTVEFFFFITYALNSV